MSRYETLNVSLQTDNHRNESRLSQTVDHENRYGQQDEQGDNNESDQRVRKFRQLYYKNQKLRRQLKLLNAKLNQRLQKVKLPTVKKRAASVDLDREPPSKALQRQLQNAYKQVQMYKQQISSLKIKEQTPENYAKLRDMENLISFKDKEISQVQQQLKSVKNIKKMQQKKISTQLQNQEVKQRIQSYKKEHKQLTERLKQISKKSRKREEQYKKQQAYLVSLGKKYRIATDDRNIQEEAEKPQKAQPLKEANQRQFQIIKAQIANQKKANDQVLKKTEVLKKQIKALRDEIHQNQQKLKDKDGLSKILQTKIIALNRLIRQQQRKPKQPPKNPLITNIQDIELKQNLNQSFSEVDQEHKQQTGSKQDLSLKKMLHQMEAGQRQWKGKYRKVQHGFGGPGDKKFQFQGNLIGFQVALDENEVICGISFIFSDKNGTRRQQPFQGKHSNIQLKWEIQPEDKIIKLSGSFTQQIYLSQMIVMSSKGSKGLFGSPRKDPFSFIISENQRISGCFGSIKQLGNDRRITQLGFWIQKI